MLTTERIEELIKNPVSKDFLDAGILIQNNHKVHITGEGYDKQLNQLVGFESKGDYNIRKQLTKPATIQLTALVLDSLNRWVTNQGTVKITQFSQTKQKEEFVKVLKQAWRGDSLENFIRTFYKDAIYQEMEGFLIVTKPLIAGKTQIREGVIKPYDGSSLDPYIIFAAAEDVHDFGGIGDNLEYLILDYGDDDGDQFFRILDDTNDTLVTYKDEKVTIENAVAHELDYTPAIQISSIAKNLKDDKVKTSPIDHVISALFRYMQKDSDLIIQMLRHMYPKLASVTTACKMCDGDGHNYNMLDGVDTKILCKECNGTGKVIPISRDGILGMPQYIDEGKTPYPGSPASYITPDNASLQIAIDDLKDLAKEILYSATGDKNLITETLNTATENLINFKGLEDRIAEIIEMVESREEFLIKTLAKMHQDFTGGFLGVSVRYGRRLVLRGENEIMTEIQAAKESGMPSSHIEELQKELISARYKNNKTELETQQLLADVEPLNGYTVDEITNLKEFVPPDDLQVKYNFSRLVDLFEGKHGPVHLFMVGKDWKKRVNAIYDELKKLKDEVLSIPGPDGQNGGSSV